MRILMVLNSLGVGGLQSVVRSLASEMVDRGHRVRVLCLTGKASGSDKFDVVEAGLTNLKAHNVPQAVWTIQKVVRDFRPDVVHSHAFHANAVSTIACLRYKSPLVVRTIHSTREGGKVHAALSRQIYSLGGINTAVSHQAAASARLRCSPMVIHNGIDAKRFAFSSDRRAIGRTALGGRLDETLILSVGRLVPAKDFGNLISAVSLCSTLLREKRVRVVVVGDGPLRHELEAQIHASGTSDLIELVGASDQIPELLAGADGYVQSSAWEGFPIAPLEALASGLPVCATLAGGTGEIRPRLLGYAPPQDSDALASCLTALAEAIRSPAQRTAVGEGTLPFDLQLWGDRWVDLYSQAIT